MNNTAADISVQDFGWSYVSFPCLDPGAELLGHAVTVLFEVLLRLFPQGLRHFTFPLAVAKAAVCPHPQQRLSF